MLLEEGLSEDDVERWVPSASVLHSNGDAMDITVSEGRIDAVRGGARPGQPRQARSGGPLRRRAVGSTDRLKRPLVRKGVRLVESDRDEAWAGSSTGRASSWRSRADRLPGRTAMLAEHATAPLA